MEHLNALKDKIEEALSECERAQEVAGSHAELLQLEACAASLEVAWLHHDDAYDAAHTESQRRLRLNKHYTAMSKRRREQAVGDP